MPGIVFVFLFPSVFALEDNITVEESEREMILICELSDVWRAHSSPAQPYIIINIADVVIYQQHSLSNLSQGPANKKQRIQ